ncbi:MAG TPA: NAD(P)H-binding protein, partial [Egibacteraceae bacterium]|nr:NAD(P)H-binding protein [Egibacteraceae bacterium]
MDVVIAGAHGKVARHLSRLVTTRGDRVRGIIRDASQAGDVRGDGATPVLLDLEAATVEQLAAAIDGADAVVFAAGAGPGSGAARKETVDYGAASKLIAAAQSAGVRRYVMVSSIGAGHPPEGDDVFS